MGKSAGKGENSRKAAGNARKAEAAASKAAAAQAQADAAEDAKWAQGAKSSKRADDAAAKRADADRKKAERAALLAAEEAAQPAKPKGAGARTAAKKSNGKATAAAGAAPARGLDLAQLGDEGEDVGAGAGAGAALNASNIDDALDALDLTSGAAASEKVERHWERRVKAAYAAFEARRMPEIKAENPGLRKSQRDDLCWKEFQKSPEHPKYQDNNASYNADKESVAQIRSSKKNALEDRLAG